MTGSYATETEVRPRLTAVLIADVKGYTSLMERDDARTRGQLKRHRDKFHALARRRGGRVLDTSGDSILAEFPSARGAVEAAAAFQAALGEDNDGLALDERMEFRVGVNVGDVLDDGETICGDAVNTAARIQQLAAPGGVCISGTVQELVEGRVPFGFQSMRERRVKNKSRPVRVFRVLLDAHPATAVGEGPTPQPVASHEPVIAVLPFQCLGGDPAQQYLGDGIAEDIITDLSRFRSVNVLARTTSFAFRDEDDRLRRLHDELNVQYALEGSVRSVGSRVRVTAQLVDCAAARPIWGDRYTHDAGAIFDVQDEVVSLIVGTIENRIVKDRPRSLTNGGAHKAYDYWLRGNRLLERASYRSNQEAASYFERALELEPEFARAYTSLASVGFSNLTLAPHVDGWHEEHRRTFDHARKALALEPADGRVHACMGWGFLLSRDFDKARLHYEIAGDLSPNDAEVLVHRGRARVFHGEAGGGLKLIDHALRLNPIRPRLYLESLGLAQFFCRRFEDCVRTFTQSPPATPENAALWACAQGMAGDLDAARRHGREFLDRTRDNWRGRDAPDDAECVGWLKLVLPMRDAGDRALLAKGLAKAGLPRPRSP